MDLNPECKLFIGGLNKDTTTDTLRLHFEQFGNLVDHVVITEGKSKVSRGFGFVTYETMDGVEKCLSEGPHTLDGRTVDVKRAIPKDINRGNNDGIDDSPRTKKVFLGGLPLSITKEEIDEVMKEFGSIEEVVIIQEKNSKTPRGFGFVIFDTYNGAAAACKRKHIKFNNYRDRDIEVKPAMSVDEMKSVRGGGGGGGRDSGRWREDRERSSRRYNDRGDRDHRYSDDYRYSDSYNRYLGSESGRGGGDVGSAGGYRDREPLYNYPDYGSSTGYGMDRYGGSGDYRSTYRPPPPDSGSGGGTYGEYTSSSAYGPGPGPGLYESSGSRDYLSAGSRGYESGSRGYGSEPVGEYGSGPGSFGTRPEGYGSDLGGGGYGAGYGGYSSNRGGSGIGPIKSHDRPLLPSRGPLNSDGRDGPYGGMGISPGGGGYGSGTGSARIPPGGGGSHGYHPYKR